MSPVALTAICSAAESSRTHPAAFAPGVVEHPVRARAVRARAERAAVVLRTRPSLFRSSVALARRGGDARTGCRLLRLACALAQILVCDLAVADGARGPQFDVLVGVAGLGRAAPHLRGDGARGQSP